MGKCVFHNSAVIGILIQGRRACYQECCILTPGSERTDCVFGALFSYQRKIRSRLVLNFKFPSKLFFLLSIYNTIGNV